MSVLISGMFSLHCCLNIVSSTSKTSGSGCNDKGSKLIKDSISSSLGSSLYGGRRRDIQGAIMSKATLTLSERAVIDELFSVVFVQIQVCFGLRLLVNASWLASWTMMSLIFFNSINSNTLRKQNGCIDLFV